MFVCCATFLNTRKRKMFFFFNFQKINVFFLFGIFVMLNFSNCNLNAYFFCSVLFEKRTSCWMWSSRRKKQIKQTLFTFCVCWRNKHVFEELFVIDMFCFRCLIVLINCYFSTGLLLFSLVILCVVCFPVRIKWAIFTYNICSYVPFFWYIYLNILMMIMKRRGFILLLFFLRDDFAINNQSWWRFIFLKQHFSR